VQLAANSEHGIFHGINRYTGKNDIENKGLLRLVYNRVGVTGTGSNVWQRHALVTSKVFVVNRAWTRIFQQ
jgi:hypothetical protein